MTNTTATSEPTPALGGNAGMSSEYLEVRNLSVSFDGFKAVDGVDLTLMQGDLSEASVRLEPVLHVDPDPQSVSLGGRLGTVRHLLNEPPWQHRDQTASLRRDIDGWLAGAHMRPQLTQ